MSDQNSHIIIVSGLPRSGTSMMMKAIDAGGIKPIVDGIRTADEDNPKGYYEFEKIKKMKDGTEWIKDAQGKVIKAIYRLLYDLPSDYQYKVVFMKRDLKEVLASQKKMLGRSGKPGASITDEQLEKLFQGELTKCEKWLLEQSNFDVLYINHRDMINDAKKQVEKINEFLGGGLNVQAMAETVDPSLYRNRNQ